MGLSRNKIKEYHIEVADALKEIGIHAYGKAVRQDRKSKLE